eukprot:TRINITY_DN31840_c0_g1_i1.p1 TRINITY_DN31840_c0_g1~~TRINITY_DN31840_c0_g1_i1.p1  ORF type:complete len:418 (+),score=90.41 TRINITY_DN31840_c0_g1_i1:76-1329(+)
MALNSNANFDLMALPNPPLEKTIEYLDFEGKKNLRLVNRNLADLVMKLNHDLRSWKIKMLEEQPKKLKKYMDVAEKKGLTDLMNFRLHLSFPCLHEDYEENCTCHHPFALYHGFLLTWKDYVYSLDANITESTHFLSVLKFPCLENLKLAMDSSDDSDIPHDTVVALLKHHKDTLKKLSADMDFMNDFSDDDIGTAPQVETVTFYGRVYMMMDDAFKALLEYAQNLKVLDYNSTRVDASDIHLPNLKRFHPARLIEESYAPFLAKNGDTIETIVSPYHYGSSDLENWFPHHMPKLRAVLARSDNLARFYLDKMGKSLQYILAPLSVYDKMSTEEMKNLKGLWLVVDYWFDEYDMLAKLPNKLHPKVAKIIVITANKGERISGEWVEKIKEVFPEAKVQDSKCWDKIVERFLATYGLD